MYITLRRSSETATIRFDLLLNWRDLTSLSVSEVQYSRILLRTELKHTKDQHFMNCLCLKMLTILATYETDLKQSLDLREAGLCGALVKLH